MKKGLFAFIFIFTLFSTIALAQYIPEEEAAIPATVENRLSLEFHAVTGTDVIVLDLKRYFGRMAPFVASGTEHVNVTIDPATGVATLAAFDPEWRGIEEVIFATAPEFLTVEEKVKKYLPPRKRNLTILNLSEDKIALIHEAFTQQQFETLIGNLSAEPVDITSFLSNSSLALDLNEEVIINFSMGEEAGAEIDFGFKIRSTNLTIPFYREPNQILYFTLALLAIGIAMAGSLYLYYNLRMPLKEVFLAPKKAAKATKVPSYKKAAKAKLKYIKKRIGKEKPSKLYREAVMLMNRFLAKAYSIRSADEEKISKQLDRHGAKEGTKAKVYAFMADYKNKIYTSKEIKDSDVHNVISYIESVLREL